MVRSGAAPTLDEYVVARGQDLLRTAWLLTGTPGAAERLAQQALAALWRHGSDPVRVREGSLDLAVWQAMANRYVRRWHRNDRRPPESPEPHHEPWEDELTRRRRDVLAALASLSRLQRAVVVLRYDSQYDDGQVAELVGRSTGAVHTERVRALSALGHLPALEDDRTGAELPERLAATFDDIVPERFDTSGLADGATEYAAQRRRLRVAAVAGGAVVVLAVGAAVAGAVDQARTTHNAGRAAALSCRGLAESADLPQAGGAPLSTRATAALLCADRTDQSIWPGSLPPDEPLRMAQGLDFLQLSPPVARDTKCAKLPVGPAFTITLLGKDGRRTTYDNVDLACNGWPALDRYFIALGEQQAIEVFDPTVDPFPACPPTVGRTLRLGQSGSQTLPRGTVFTAGTACLHQEPDPSRVPVFRRPVRAVLGKAELAVLTHEAQSHGSGPLPDRCIPQVPPVSYVLLRLVTSTGRLVELVDTQGCAPQFLVDWSQDESWTVSPATADTMDAVVGQPRP